METVIEDRPASIWGEDASALIVAVGVIRQAHCVGELPDEGGEGSRDAVLGNDTEIVECDEKLIELRLLAGPFERLPGYRLQRGEEFWVVRVKESNYYVYNRKTMREIFIFAIV